LGYHPTLRVNINRVPEVTGMARLLALITIVALVALASGCGPTGTPSNCTFSVQLAQHPGSGPFHGAGLPSAGGSFSVDVAVSPTSCAIPTYSPDSWITIAQEVPDRGLSYSITATANPGSARRTGTANVGYQSLIVDQAGSSGSGCTFQLIPAASTFGPTGGTGAFVIVASDQKCGWDADRSQSGEDWSSVPRPNRGVGTTGLVFDVRSSTAASQPPLPRQAQIPVRDSAGAAAGSHQYQQQ
jgi:hypothetical protein